MLCPKCKEVYDDGSIYCVACGTRLVHEKIKNNDKGTPIERFSTRVKTSKPKTEENVSPLPKKDVPSGDDKLDILILQNNELIKQNNKIIELLEKLTR